MIDRGSAPLKYEPNIPAARRVEFILKSTRVYVIFKALFDLISGSIKK